MTAPAQARFWRVARRLFRWLRIALLLAVLLAMIGGIYLNLVGLPDFLKRRVAAELRAHGLELEFTRLRLRWYRGIVAEHVRLGSTHENTGPQMAIEELDLRPNSEALRRFKLHIESVVFQRGRVVWTLIESNRPTQVVSLDRIDAELRLLPEDRWELRKFQARFLEATIQLSGTLTNASYLLARKPAPAGARTNDFFHAAREGLRRFADALTHYQLAATPALSLNFNGDARDWTHFDANLQFTAPEASTPWGQAQHILLVVQRAPAGTARRPGEAELLASAERVHSRWGRAQSVRVVTQVLPSFTHPWPTNGLFHLELKSVETPWGRAQNLQGTARFSPVATNADLLQADTWLTTTDLRTPWGQAAAGRLTAQTVHSLTNPIPAAGSAEVDLDRLQTEWAGVSHAHLNLRHNLRAPGLAARGDPSWARWAELEPFAFDWDAELTEVTSPRLQADKIISLGTWRAPEVNVSRLHAELYGGQFEAAGRLDVATRQLEVAGSSNFDVQRISPLLTAKSQRWLAQYSWKQPPKLEGEVRLVLPAWTNREPDWRAEVPPTLQLRAHFDVGDGAFRGVPASSARSHLVYSNQFWHFPDLVVTRPEGQAELAYHANDRTKDYHWRIRSRLDLKVLKPLFDEAQQRGFDYFEFTTPPFIDGEVWGRWTEQDRTGFAARVTATNFTFRGERVEDFSAEAAYTNLLLTLKDARLLRPEGQATAPEVRLEFSSGTVRVTNAFSTLDPQAVARAIGPKAAEHFSDYQFLKPPAARVNGVIPMRERDRALTDVRFVATGGPFAWWKFQVPQISGSVAWRGDTLTLTNLQAAFYQGHGGGYASFDFSPAKGNDFQFQADINGANLPELMADLTTQTNNLEGALSGRLTITAANTADRQSWQGHGRVTLRDGLVWEIPIFGIFSPALDAIMPGLGRSRASEGTATFTITNSVIRSEDLEIRAPALRMHYAGTVDFAGRVDARVEAALLRDTWLIGRVVSLALWPLTKLFEYKVSGTLAQPKSEPLYVPKLLLFPLHPLRTLKELFSEEPKNPPAPTPPDKPTPQQ